MLISDTNWPSLLKAFRLQRSLTQANLAELLRVDPTTISRWERGRDKPEINKQRQLRDLMHRKDVGLETAVVQLIDKSTSFAMLVDEHWRVVRTSRLHQETLRYATSDIYGKDFRDVRPESTGPILSDSNRRELDRTVVELVMDYTRAPLENGFGNKTELRIRGSITLVRTPRGRLHIAIGSIVPPEAPFAAGVVSVTLDDFVS